MKNNLVNVTGYDIFIFYGLLIGGVGFVFITPTPGDMLLFASLGAVLVLSALVFFGLVWIYSYAVRNDS